MMFTVIVFGKYYLVRKSIYLLQYNWIQTERYIISCFLFTCILVAIRRSFYRRRIWCAVVKISSSPVSRPLRTVTSQTQSFSIVLFIRCFPFPVWTSVEWMHVLFLLHFSFSFWTFLEVFPGGLCRIVSFISSFSLLQACPAHKL